MLTCMIQVDSRNVKRNIGLSSVKVISEKASNNIIFFCCIRI